MLRSEDDKPQAICATRVMVKWVENTKVERIKQAIGGSYGLDDSMSSLRIAAGKERVKKYFWGGRF